MNLKKHVIPFLLIMILLPFSYIHAGEHQGRLTVSADAGLGIPVAAFADDDKGAATTEFGFSGSMEYWVTDNLSFGGMFLYNKFGMEEDILEPLYEEAFGVPVEIWDVTRKVRIFGGFGKYTFPGGDKVAPYAKLGAGVAKMKFEGLIRAPYIELDDDTHGEYDSRLTLLGAVGVSYRLSQRITFNAEALVIHIATDGAEGSISIPTSRADFLPEAGDHELSYNTQVTRLSLGLSYMFDLIR
jgi:hypothetical protein